MKEYIIVTIILFFTFSCKKEKEDTIEQPPKTSNLPAKTWTLENEDGKTKNLGQHFSYTVITDFYISVGFTDTISPITSINFQPYGNRIKTGVYTVVDTPLNDFEIKVNITGLDSCFSRTNFKQKLFVNFDTGALTIIAKDVILSNKRNKTSKFSAHFSVWPIFL